MDIRNVAVFSVNESDMLAVFELRGMVSQKEIQEKFYRLANIVFGEANRMDDRGYHVIYYPIGCAIRSFGNLCRK